MSNWRDQEPVTDEDLVAYLDGKFEKEDAEWLEREVNMDRALEERLELMRRGDRPFAKAYDLLLKDAPNKRLKQILKLAKNPPPPLVKKPVVRPEPVMAPVEEVYKEPWGGWRMLAAAAVLLAVFGGGFVTSRFIQLPSELPQLAGDPAEQGWRATVAYYQTLFVKETLAQASENAEVQSANLRAALANVGLDLSVGKVSVEPLHFKRAEVLNFRGKPLVQVAYLFNGVTPVSFCIIRGRKPAFDVKAERREGLNIAHWRSSEYGFMVIGDVPQDELNRIARKLKQQVS
ncbi:MAG: anti-sigma factor family protein [Alphaproteobacteria bacterium]